MTTMEPGPRERRKGVGGRTTMVVLLVLLAITSRAVPATGSYHSGVSPMPHVPAVPKDPNSRCEEITIPMCRGIGYNLTAFPNEMNHETQDEAGLEVHQFWPLVEIKCSPDLKFFLCSMYTPICIEDYHKPLPVCRSVCERARAGCAPIMEQYSFNWPERMACENLPVSGDSDNLCMEMPSEEDSHGGSGGSGGDRSSSGGGGGGGSHGAGPGGKPTRKSHSGGGGGAGGQGGSNGGGNNSNNKCKGKNSKNCQNPPGERTKECTCRCREPLVALGRGEGSITSSISGSGSTTTLLHHHGGSNQSVERVGDVQNCAIPCRGAFFTQEEKDFAGIWIALWSGLCGISTLMTLTTFLIDTERFKYPERPIVFLSACYFLVSCGYLARLFLGHDEIACDGRSIKYPSTGQSSCTLIFILVYFFGMASSIWWVILSFTWFLAAGLKWGNEAISKHSQYFHLAAWLVPTVQTVSVLLRPAVDGDPVAGICYVGNTSVEHLKNFVLAPLFMYLVVGTTFLMAGFVSLFRIRSVIKQQGGIGAGSKADKLEKLMIRIGIFSVLYTVPATIVIGCHLYEAAYFEDWMTSLTCPCKAASLTPGLRQRPLYSVLMLKYFMALAVGITSGVWIWSGKTVDSWRRLWRRLFGSPDPTGAGQVLIKPRPPLPQPYATSGIGGVVPPGSAAASLLATPYTQTVGSVASTSHHHLHHHVLKQAGGGPLSHV